MMYISDVEGAVQRYEWCLRQYSIDVNGIKGLQIHCVLVVSKLVSEFQTQEHAISSTIASISPEREQDMRSEDSGSAEQKYPNWAT